MKYDVIIVGRRVGGLRSRQPVVGGLRTARCCSWRPDRITPGPDQLPDELKHDMNQAASEEGSGAQLVVRRSVHGGAGIRVPSTSRGARSPAAAARSTTRSCSVGAPGGL